MKHATGAEAVSAPPRHGSNSHPAAPGPGRPCLPSCRPGRAGRQDGSLVSAGRRLLAVADALPITVPPAIAGARWFTHIRDTAAQHGQSGPMSWAVAVCTGLTCVMAARKRQRDKQLGTVTRRLSWPAVVLAGGVGLSLAANLAQAQPDAWGRIVAPAPPGAFLVAVSMIERRAARRPRPVAAGDGAAGEPSAPGTAVPGARCRGRGPGRRTRRCSPSRAGSPPSTRTSMASRSPATALRARLGVSNQAASELLSQLHSVQQGHPPGTSRAA